MGCGTSSKVEPIVVKPARISTPPTKNVAAKKEPDRVKSEAVIKSVKKVNIIPDCKFDVNKKWRLKAAEAESLINGLKDGELFIDADFKYFDRPPNDDMEETKDDIQTEIRWLRPHELVRTPIIGLDNAKPDECQQGTLGDCWLIAGFGAVAKFPSLLSRVIADNQILYGINYQGFAKVSFWQYGEWIDIYIDDKLPTRRNNLIFGHCKTSSNFWLPLLEKAYAKLVGSYEYLVGGHSERAIIDLTGALTIQFKPGEMNSLPDRYRFEDEMTDRQHLLGCAAIRFEKQNKTSVDDFDGHAYSILAITKAISSVGSLERIYTLRNPHGIAKEYNRLNSKNQIWTKLDDQAKRNILYDGKEVLSWMNAGHLMHYFHNLTLAYHTPGLNEAGKLYEFVGAWRGPISNEVSAKSYLRLPHYLLHVDKAAKDKVDVVVNLLQEEREKNKLLCISIISFTVRQLGKVSDDESMLGLVNYTSDKLPKTTHMQHRQESRALNLSPGYHILVPSVTQLTAQSLKYLFRVFSLADISVEELELRGNNGFYRKDGKYVKIVTLRCSLCDQIITSEYSYNDKFTYHKECYDKFQVCDFCNKKIDGQYYNMDHGIHYCSACYENYKNRVSSAKNKFTSL